MDQRLHFITVATRDLDGARAFYVNGLGWKPTLDVPEEIIFFQVAPGVILGFFDAKKFAEDINASVDVPTSVSGLTLAHNVGSPEEVDQVMATAVRAGATIIKPPQHAAFGGYNGHFADPNGTVWEIAHNPGWQVDESGKVSLEVIDPS